MLLRKSTWRTLRVLLRIPLYVFHFLLCLSLALAIFSPVYTSAPANYAAIREAIKTNPGPGAGNPFNRRVFVAANVISADTVRGPWTTSLLQLIHLLHPDNVFLSIYQNDGDDAVVEALHNLRSKLECKSHIVVNDHIDLEALPKVQLPLGRFGVSRFEYLAYVRNRAVLPLRASAVNHTSPLGNLDPSSFEYVLFLNDIIYDPLQAVQLLFATRNGLHYDAACAADFVSVTNFYDAFATRDSNGHELGYGPGLRLFPWFSTHDGGRSRAAVISGSDSVPVRSCWGGMVAFDAKWFLGPDALSFRALGQLWTSASECCLIHADIAQRSEEPVIVLNPYVRVAYTERTFAWLWVAARFEHGFRILQWLLTITLSSSPAERTIVEPTRSDQSRSTYHTVEPIDNDHQTEVGQFCYTQVTDIMKINFAEANAQGIRNFEMWT